MAKRSDASERKRARTKYAAWTRVRAIARDDWEEVRITEIAQLLLAMSPEGRARIERIVRGLLGRKRRARGKTASR